MTKIKEQKSERLVAKDAAVFQSGVPFRFDPTLPGLVLLVTRLSLVARLSSFTGAMLAVNSVNQSRRRYSRSFDWLM